MYNTKFMLALIMQAELVRAWVSAGNLGTSYISQSLPNYSNYPILNLLRCLLCLFHFFPPKKHNNCSTPCFPLTPSISWQPPQPPYPTLPHTALNSTECLFLLQTITNHFFSDNLLSSSGLTQFELKNSGYIFKQSRRFYEKNSQGRGLGNAG